MSDAHVPIGAGRYIGQRVPRKEDARLLTGRGTFVDDVSVPGMLHVAFVRSPIARGRIRRIDLAAAKQLPGVHAIVTAEDLARFKITMLNFFLGAPAIEVGPLAIGRVAYVGDPVALVVAQDRYIAEDAAGLVVVDYDEEDPVVTIDDARRGAPVHPDTETNVAVSMGEKEDEDLERQLAAAPHLVKTSIKHQRISQSPMETRGIVVDKHGEGELTVYLATQSPQMAARYLSLAFGIPKTGIRVISKDVGGSFGLKVQPWREEVAVVAAGMLLGRPLKWIEDRLENLTAANQAREQEIAVRAGFDADGRMLCALSDYSINNGAFPHGADCNIAVSIFLWSAYKMPAFNFHTTAWYSNTVGLAAYRGPWALESLARETLLDVAAQQIGIDPVEIRRRNLVTKADQPRTTPFGIELTDITPAECLELLVQSFDVIVFRAEQAAARKEGRYLGLGMAAYIEPTAGSAGIGVLRSDVAHLRIEPTGKVTATLSTHSQGHGTQTTMAQVIAEHLGVALSCVSVYEDDSSRGGYGAGASGSRQAVAGGGASIKAAEILSDKVRRAAAHILEVTSDRIRLDQSNVYVDGDPSKTRPLREIAEIAYNEPERLPEGMEAGLEATYRYQPPPITLTSAAHACVVEVDAETGFVHIKRWISSEDCGVMINPAVVEGQIAGGLAQAIGTVLHEEVAYDPRGNPIAVTYKDYHLPAITDVPDFEYLHGASTPSKAEGGFRGVGEGGCIVGPPTLVNAIHDALEPFGGLPRDLELPLSPTRILEIVEGRSMAPKPAEQASGVTTSPSTPDFVRATTTTPAEDGARTNSGATTTPADVVARTKSGMPSVAQAARPIVDGTWALVLATPMGPQKFAGTFKTQGALVTGTLDSDMGSQAFEGTADGGHVKFDLKVTKPMSLTLKYDIQIEGDKLVGKVKMGIFGNAKLTGERRQS